MREKKKKSFQKSKSESLGGFTLHLKIISGESKIIQFFFFFFISLLSYLFLSLLFLLCLPTHIETHCHEPMANPSTGTRSIEIHKIFIAKSTATKTNKNPNPKSKTHGKFQPPKPLFFPVLNFSFFQNNLGFLPRMP